MSTPIKDTFRCALCCNESGLYGSRLTYVVAAGARRRVCSRCGSKMPKLNPEKVIVRGNRSGNFGGLEMVMFLGF